MPQQQLLSFFSFCHLPPSPQPWLVEGPCWQGHLLLIAGKAKTAILKTLWFLPPHCWFAEVPPLHHLAANHQGGKNHSIFKTSVFNSPAISDKQPGRQGPSTNQSWGEGKQVVKLSKLKELIWRALPPKFAEIPSHDLHWMHIRISL